MQAVAPKTKTEVRLYKDEIFQESGKIKGRFHSATDDSVTLRLKDGQTRTLQKQTVHKVLTHRPIWRRYQGWVTAAVFSLLMGILMQDTTGAEPGEVPLIGSIGIGVPTLIAFLVAPKMGPIYDVPPKHRTRTQGDKQSGAEDKASEKPEGPRSDE